MHINQNSNRDILTFPLNVTELIRIDLYTPLAHLYCCEEVDAYFVENDHAYLLSTDCILEVIRSFHGSLQAALANKAQQHPSIIKDLGFSWNEVLQEKPGAVFEEHWWVGLQNLVWSTRGNARPCLNTWLYNDAQEAIILAITPCYPWHYVEPKPEEQFVPYEKWITTYKPLFERTISRACAQAWLKQANDILDLLENNRKKFEQGTYAVN